MMEVTPDLIRLLALPVFFTVAVLDIRTRRVPSIVWPPLVIFGSLILGWELWQYWNIGGFIWDMYVIRVALSVGVLVPLAVLFWRLHAFGGADAKALATIAILFPTFPTYEIGSIVLPVVDTQLGVFSLTILTNAVLLGLIYPVGLAVRNAVYRDVHPAMFVGLPVGWESLDRRHGRLLESSDGFTKQGLDLDALRMYLRWRGCSLVDIRENPEMIRTTRPASTNPPGDGRVTDGGEELTDDDPWGARAFLDDANGAYGTRPETLRDALFHLSSADEIWISPGIPFLVPMVLGLVLALTAGDLLFWAISPLLPI